MRDTERSVNCCYSRKGISITDREAVEQHRADTHRLMGKSLEGYSSHDSKFIAPSVLDPA